ncbi:hypothetical protein BMT73_20010 [Escherichia coli]|nr:hypothetical protein [Enterobacter roggenkampii]OOJ06588.1 hypothetical protein BMT73_20010 [Escherichia coli]HAX4944221.1 hypothetical protein [Escherichia coli]
MTKSYMLTTTPLLASNAQLRWNIDTTSKQTPIQLKNGRIQFSGWLLAEGERSPHLAIKNDYATYSFPFNVKRPDVIAAILQESADNHPRLNCGFKINVPFSSQICLGLESNGLITWLTELNFSPA